MDHTSHLHTVCNMQNKARLVAFDFLCKKLLWYACIIYLIKNNSLWLTSCSKSLGCNMKFSTIVRNPQVRDISNRHENILAALFQYSCTNTIRTWRKIRILLSKFWTYYEIHKQDLISHNFFSFIYFITLKVSSENGFLYLKTLVSSF